MKNNIIIGLIFIAFTASCSNKNNTPDAYGNFESKEIVISAKSNGELISFNIEEGSVIKSGDQIGLIDTIQQSLNKDQLVAKSNLIKTKLEGIDAQINIQEEQKKTFEKEKERIKKLLKDNAIPEKKLDDINAQLNILKIQIESIEIQKNTVYKELEMLNKNISIIDKQLSDCKIINPVNGTILEKYSEQHELVMAGKPLYKIADISTMELRAYVSATQLDNIKIGQEVTVLIDKNEKETHSFNGTISWISSKAEFTPKIIQTKEERTNLVYAMKVIVKNNGEIKIGMPGEIVFNQNHN